MNIVGSHGDTIRSTRNLWESGATEWLARYARRNAERAAEILDAKGTYAGYALAQALWDDGVHRPIHEDSWTTSSWGMRLHAPQSFSVHGLIFAVLV